ncbi:glycosyl transferase [Bacillus cereus]|uniref:glycosyltransferase n=1 Tax=Bacillus nitratireducens TaxID=2026193 RepID=UPI000BF78E1F|nr:glycosyl transferase [Bacillus cereus]PEZ86852.1 glycosyl transferase [Bacillus cereus]PFA34496.1 glycosyl transferase [Bacillus cereus]PFE54903.1 glycosyl transferase [Bacillus cereus]PFI35477.1 glycosyl transferase [Bacillus cereus]
MKKNILFVIDSLTIGGAEKSLISLLNLIDPSKYAIDVMLFKKGGDLETYIPNYVNVLKSPSYFRYINNEKFPKSKRFTYLSYRIKTSLNLRLNNYRKSALHSEQVVFRSLNKIIMPIQKKYDVAIAYSQGMPTYFVANKVSALQKIAWINTDYANTLYDKDVDFKSYKKMDKIIAVSENTRNSVYKIRKEYYEKVDILLDIVCPSMIHKLAQEYEVEEFDKTIINILTVGRLVTAKAYSKAIEVAKLLKASGYKFKWFAIGEGPEKIILQELIDRYELNGYFVLLGKKLNPYPYMENCDIYVQTSLKEGFGLTVSEAKILKKTIVCTNFATAKEIINHNTDGLIVEHDIESIYKGVRRYIDDNDFREEISKELNSMEPYNSVNQLEKFYDLIEN